MKKYARRQPGIMGLVIRILPAILIGLIYIFEMYTITVQGEGDSSLPPLFGNFTANRALLENEQGGEAFAFAVVGDTKSIGTFERIAVELRKMPLDFAFLLGDCSYGGTEDDHRYFRAECHDEYALPFPVFYVVGNHDVSPGDFPIKRFEEVYGPSNFSFEYRQCLFIVLRILNEPFTNNESLDFLAGFRDVDLSRYRHTFVFFHIPPPISPTFKARTFEGAEAFMELFDRLGIEYVFAGDYHGYLQSKRGRTTYIITGGGGAALVERPGEALHHAITVYVTPKSVDTQIVSVPGVKETQDHLERIAITDAWPWLRQNTTVAVGLNMLGAILFVLSIWWFLRHVGQTGERSAVDRDASDGLMPGYAGAGGPPLMMSLPEQIRNRMNRKTSA
ncbi:MAG: metallophosphoesterase [Thermodesulfobacteriota bacterium]